MSKPANHPTWPEGLSRSDWSVAFEELSRARLRSLFIKQFEPLILVMGNRYRQAIGRVVGLGRLFQV